MGAPLVDQLADAGIHLRSLRPGSNHRLLCPSCHGGRSKDDDLSVSVDDDGAGAKWQCHNCGLTGGVRERPEAGRPFPKSAKPYVVPKPHDETQKQRPSKLYEFFAKRGISQETVDLFGVYATRHGFRIKGDWVNKDAIVFPYFDGGVMVNRKFRSVDKDLSQDGSPKHTLYNVDAIQSFDVVVWVEGEADTLAMHEAGYPQTVSLKDGAPQELLAENDPKRDTQERFNAMDTHADMLSRVGCFILAGDMDAPGLILREELARRLGRHRCKLVTWPDGCKDACDVLAKLGKDAVSQCIEAALPYPIKDVQQITGSSLMAYLETLPPPVLSTGCWATDKIVQLPSEGRLVVVTGIPNAGKSVWTRFLMVHTAKDHDRRWLVFSPEMQPWEMFAASCAEVYLGKPARASKKAPGLPYMTHLERGQAGDWLSDRIRFLSLDAEDVAPSVEWLLERARDCVLRFGVTDLLIDPWNELDHQRGGSSETDYIGRALQRLKAFGFRHGCNIWIVCHPAKMQPAKQGDKLHPPGPYDISGSAHWANKADLGLTVHTGQNDVTEIHLWKARFNSWGRKGAKADLEFDPTCGRYRSASVQDAVNDGEDDR